MITWRNSPTQWGDVQKWLHWIIAALILGGAALAIFLVNQEEGVKENQLRYIQYIKVHKSIGILAAMLIVARIAWVVHQPRPGYPDSMADWQKLASKLTVWGLYALMILVPLSGHLSSSSFGARTTLFELFVVPNIWPKDSEAIKIFHPIHKYGSFALLGLVALHIGAALHHHFIIKDDILKRMLPWGRPGTPDA